MALNCLESDNVQKKWQEDERWISVDTEAAEEEERAVLIEGGWTTLMGAVMLGLGAWIGVNGVYAELPVLVEILPEG